MTIHKEGRKILLGLFFMLLLLNGIVWILLGGFVFMPLLVVSTVFFLFITNF
ncbi:MAG: phosphatidylserine decarboxylase family protein, partial [Bacteroidia bacterium]|nr:phosphatidylserine decarboxylase family protein [Bacteroidia bacterium]